MYVYFSISVQLFLSQHFFQLKPFYGREKNWILIFYIQVCHFFSWHADVCVCVSVFVCVRLDGFNLIIWSHVQVRVQVFLTLYSYDDKYDEIKIIEIFHVSIDFRSVTLYLIIKGSWSNQFDRHKNKIN